MGKPQGAGQIVKNSIPELELQLPLQRFALACFLSAGFFLACRFPSGQPSPPRCTLGRCSQNARFPPAPGSTTKEQLSLLSHSHSEERLGCTSFCHILNLCISSTACCTALHFWLSECVEHVHIGVQLGVHTCGDNGYGLCFQGLSF